MWEDEDSNKYAEMDSFTRQMELKKKMTVEQKNTSVYSDLLGTYVDTKTGDDIFADQKRVLDSNGWRKE